MSQNIAHGAGTSRIDYLIAHGWTYHPRYGWHPGPDYAGERYYKDEAEAYDLARSRARGASL